MLMTFLLSVCVCLTYGEFEKRHVQNSAYPYHGDVPSYNIGSWAKQLHLQQCAFVEVGADFLAIFVEVRPRRYDPDHYIREYFIGYCDNETLSQWPLCTADLGSKRDEDCHFNNDAGMDSACQNARVHRRLCDITHIQNVGKQCSCFNMGEEPLNKVDGFPTCFKQKLPYSVCGPDSVCGESGCYPYTVNERIHSVVCDPECKTHQPFCENPLPRTTRPRVVHSFWTDWSNPYCTDNNCMSLYDEASCINKNTKSGDIDCFGPGTSCCMDNLDNCKCHVFQEDDVLRVIRTFTVASSDLDQYDEEEFLNNLQIDGQKYVDNSAKQRFARSNKQFEKPLFQERKLKFRNIPSRKTNLIEESQEDEEYTEDVDNVKRLSRSFRKAKDVSFEERRIKFENLPSRKSHRSKTMEEIEDEEEDEKTEESKEEDILLEEDDEIKEKSVLDRERDDLKHKERKNEDVEVKEAKESEDLDSDESGCEGRTHVLWFVVILLKYGLGDFVF